MTTEEFIKELEATTSKQDLALVLLEPVHDGYGPYPYPNMFVSTIDCLIAAWTRTQQNTDSEEMRQCATYVLKRLRMVKRELRKWITVKTQTIQ